MVTYSYSDVNGSLHYAKTYHAGGSDYAQCGEEHTETYTAQLSYGGYIGRIQVKGYADDGISLYINGYLIFNTMASPDIINDFQYSESITNHHLKNGSNTIKIINHNNNESSLGHCGAEGDIQRFDITIKYSTTIPN